MKAVVSTLYWAAVMASFNMKPDKLLPSKNITNIAANVH